MIWVSDSQWNDVTQKLGPHRGGARDRFDQRQAMLETVELPLPVSVAKRSAARIANNRWESLVIFGLLISNGATGFALVAIAASSV